MFADRLMRFKWTLQPPGNRVLCKLSAIGTEVKTAQVFRQLKSCPLNRIMLARAVDLNKPADHLDIFLLLLC